MTFQHAATKPTTTGSIVTSVARRRRTGTRVRRKIRRIELWPALKMAVLFHLACFAMTMVVLVVVWNVLDRAGFVEKISSFLVDIGFADGLTISGPVLARGAAFVGAALVVHNTLLTFLLVLLYNLFSSLFGGLVISVIEETPPGQKHPVLNNNQGKATTSTRPRKPPKTSQRSRLKQANFPPTIPTIQPALPLPASEGSRLRDDLDGRNSSVQPDDLDIDDTETTNWLADIGDEPTSTSRS
jgi:Transmembrane domain of unknown function (DUF3566)